MKSSRVLTLAVLSLVPVSATALADGCTTQSQMKPADRDSLSAASLGLVKAMQSGNPENVRALTVPQYAKDFNGIQYAVTNASPHLKDATLTVKSVWLLDGTNLKPASDGTLQDGQFFCKLHPTGTDTTFLIPSLPSGKYAFTIVDANSAKPWQIAMLLQDQGGAWKLAGLFPRSTTAGGHDGLWYWRQGREFAAKNQRWSAWLDYVQAESLLKPVDFISSDHLDRLHDEASKVTPPALSQGIGNDTPLVVKAADGKEYRFTSIGTDDTLAADRIDLALHLKTDALPDPAAARQRNASAAHAFLAAYPELRQLIHGVWVYAESPGQSPFATEHPLNNLQ